MAGEDKEFLIEEETPKVEDDDLLVVAPEVEEKKAAPAAPTPEDGVAELRRQLEEAVEEKRKALARARELEQSEYSARTEQWETNKQLVESAIAEMQRNDEILRAGLVEANAAGDFARVAEIQSELITTRDSLRRLEEGLETYKAKPVQKPAETVVDPVEHFASQLSAKSAEWVRAHPQCVTDGKLYRKMLASHEMALANDIKPDTPEYFAALDQSMGFNKAVDKVEDASPLSSAAAEAKAPVVAPVSRAGSGSGKQVVRLTAAEREAASDFGMTEQEYARHKLALQREGKITTH